MPRLRLPFEFSVPTLESATGVWPTMMSGASRTQHVAAPPDTAPPDKAAGVQVALSVIVLLEALTGRSVFGDLFFSSWQPFF